MYEIGVEELSGIVDVFSTRQFMRYRGGEGGYTEQFEKALCEKMGVDYALTVNSGTSALICALAAMGIGPGDEVIVPAFTWVASAMAVCAVGAVPIMAEIDETLTLDPEDVERKITPYTKAIIPVHMFNLPCDMDAMMALAKDRNLLVCEDACQAAGMSFKGKRLGSIGDTGTFSFNSFKTITCGEGGAVLTRCERTYQRALMYHDAGSFTRDHASSIKEPFFPGVNYRVSEIQGAILQAQLRRLDGIIERLQERRRIIADIVAGSTQYRIVEHHDVAGAASIAICFDTEQEARSFRESHEGLLLLIDSGRHVYANWEPLLAQRSFHPGMNPFNWANRKIEYSKEMCPVTLDILKRSALVMIPYDKSESETARFAETLLG